MRTPRQPASTGRLTRGFARRLLRAQRGSTAIEFAMLAFPALFMLFAVLEVGVVFLLDSDLETAVAGASRLVRTGQAQAQGMTRDGFEEEVCSRMSLFTSQCPGAINVDVRVLPQFGGQSPPEPTAAGFPQSYDQGAAGSIVLVRVWYRQPLLTPFLEQGLSRFGDGHVLVTTTSAFRNEPF